MPNEISRRLRPRKLVKSLIRYVWSLCVDQPKDTVRTVPAHAPLAVQKVPELDPSRCLELRCLLRVAEAGLLKAERVGVPSPSDLGIRFFEEIGATFMAVIDAGVLPPVPDDRFKFDSKSRWTGKQNVGFNDLIAHVILSSKNLFVDPENPEQKAESWYVHAVAGECPLLPDPMHRCLAEICKKLGEHLRVSCRTDEDRDAVPATGASTSPVGIEMVTITTAAAAIKMDPGQLSRLVSDGRIESNGKKGRDRRVVMASAKNYADNQKPPSEQKIAIRKSRIDAKLRNSNQIKKFGDSNPQFTRGMGWDKPDDSDD